MQKIVKLTENDVQRMIYEAVQEISYGTLMNASQMGLDTERVEKALRDIESQLEDSASGYENAEANKYYQAALNGVEAIRTYFQRKRGQADWIGNVTDSARMMRNNDEDDGQITRAEYVDAEDTRARRSIIGNVNREIEDTLRSYGYTSIPNGKLPKVTNYWSNQSTDKLDVQVLNDYYDELESIIKEIMGWHGYRLYDVTDNSNESIMHFVKVKQR